MITMRRTNHTIMPRRRWRAVVLAPLLFDCSRSVDSESEHLRRRAIAMDETGDLDTALELFQLVAARNPYDWQSAKDLCVVHHRRDELQSALRACRQAVALSDNPVAAETLDEVLDDLGAEQRGEEERQRASRPASCPDDPDGRARCALDALSAGDADAAVRTLCHDEAHLRVDSTIAGGDSGSSSSSSSSTVDPAAAASALMRARAALRVCGVVVLSRELTRPHVARLHEQATREYDALVRRVAPLDGDMGLHAEASAETNTTTSAQRSFLRYEVTFALGGAAIEEETTRGTAMLEPLLAAALDSERLELDTHSHVTSLPGAPAQRWHRDTDQRLARADWGDPRAASRPPHCLVLFLPLTDVSADMGPTEYVLGSHLDCEPSLQVPYLELQLDAEGAVRVNEGGGESGTEHECPYYAPRPFAATAEAGDAILFDSRVTHRGGANTAARRRVQMYTTFAREWFVDRVNFQSKQSRAFDDLEPRMRKLFSRLDARRYVELLEAALHERGADVAALRSKAGYDAYDYHTWEEAWGDT